MRYLIYAVIFFISHTLLAQQKGSLSDASFNKYREAIQYSLSSDLNRALRHSEAMEKSANPIHQAFAKGTQAYIFSVQGDKARAAEKYEESAALLKTIPKSPAKETITSYLLNYWGLIDLNNKNLPVALDKFVRGKKISEAIGDKQQVIKFNNNIAIINAEVRNYASAIKASKQSAAIIDKIQNLYSKDYFMIKKSNLYFNLGKYYEEYYYLQRDRPELLDSALFYLNKTMVYTNNSVKKQINTQIGMGNIYKAKNDFTGAEKMYLGVLSTAKENNLMDDYFRTMCNLGDLYFYEKEYMKSLVCFKKIDSVYYASKAVPEEFLNSSYYQAKIYSELGKEDDALRYTKIYFDMYEKLQLDENAQSMNVNSRLSRETIKEELEAIRQDFWLKSLLKKIVTGVFCVLLIGLLVLLLVNRRRKRIAEQKILSLIEEYKSADHTLAVALAVPGESEKKASKHSATLISAEKEQEILDRLKIIEEKLYYLRPDFTQQSVARKIKTNTSYLSVVVNKYYNKTFGEYFNELRINWVIKEMINNPKYRKYSTQAIAESAGFKSAVSFTKSFNKRTGVTPVQFIKGLEKNSLTN